MGHLQNLGSYSKKTNRFLGRNPNFWAPKNGSLLDRNHVPAMTGSCAKKKVPFSQKDISLSADLLFFWPNSAFRQNVKTAFLRNSGWDQVCC